MSGNGDYTELSKSKWLMKQYWRVGTVRAILSLILGMLVLGKYYYEFIPILEPLGLLGALILGGSLILLFIGIGWAYDVKAKMWNETYQVAYEREPFSYVIDWRAQAVDYPAMYVLALTLKRVVAKSGGNTEPLDNLAVYIDNLVRKSPTDKRNLTESTPESEEFLKKHPFEKGKDLDSKKASFRARVKKRFELEVLRLNYSQSFTGLAQDVLVFAALVMTVIFPDEVVNDIVSVELLIIGILTISIPLFTLMIIAGWYYDKKLKMWSPEIMVDIERNPFSYIPEPRTFTMAHPIFYTLLHTFVKILRELKVETASIEKIAEYIDNFARLSTSNEKDLGKARKLRDELGEVFLSSSQTLSGQGGK